MTYIHFITKLASTFDSYCLSLALITLFKKVLKTNIKTFNSFATDVIELLNKYNHKNILLRNSDLSNLTKTYKKLLKKYNIYLTKTPQPSQQIVKLVRSISEENIKKDLKKKDCPLEKPDYNHITNRCLMKCKENKMRDANFKCVTSSKNKTRKIYKNNSFKKSSSNSSYIKSTCVKKGKDYNPFTRRCNKPCKDNQERNSDFKCVKKNI